MILTSIAVGPATAAPPTTDGPTAAGYGATWLAAEVDAGLPVQNFGSGDWGATLDTGLALVGAQRGSAQVTALWDAVVANREAVVAPGGTDSPGRLAKAILLAHGLGEDATAVGDAPGADLVARLSALRQLAGPDEGLFGTADATYDGAYRQGMSLAALDAVGVTADPTSIEWLENQQCDDGSWMPYRADTSIPCAFDPDLFVGPDSNSTAAGHLGLTIQAPSSASIAAAVQWMDDNQNDDGGWGFYPGDVSDPNSTSVVMVSLGSATTSADFTDREGAPMQALLSFQLGCTSPEAERGAFTYPGSNDAPNLMATAQAVPAAAGVPVDFQPTEISAELPVVDCLPATTTTTSTTSTTVSTTSTSTPASSTTSVAPVTSAPTTSVDVANNGAVSPASSNRGSTGSTGSSTAAGTSRSTALASTGSTSSPLVLIGVALMLLGAVSFGSARRVGRQDS